MAPAPLQAAQIPEAQTPLQQSEPCWQLPAAFVQAHVPATQAPLQHGRLAQLCPPTAHAPEPSEPPPSPPDPLLDPLLDPDDPPELDPDEPPQPGREPLLPEHAAARGRATSSVHATLQTRLFMWKRSRLTCAPMMSILSTLGRRGVANRSDGRTSTGSRTSERHGSSGP